MLPEILNNSFISTPLLIDLGDNVVHVWCADLLTAKKKFKKLSQYLAGNELLRAEKFYFEKDKINYIFSRGVLRNIISSYSGEHPKDIHFSYNQYGKPFLQGSNLSFNVSHSGNKILYAFTIAFSIGVDIESFKNNIDFLSIAKRFFSNNEYEKLCSIDPKWQQLAFYRCWTRKEAYIKAIGRGLHCPLTSFEVSLLPSEEPMLLRSEANQTNREIYKLVEILLDENYIASIATSNNFTHIKYFNCTEL